jgi:hypothetical protein
MASARLLEYKRRADKIPVAPKGRPYVMSINSAEHDRVFRRTQSTKMAALRWEKREPKLRSICRDIALFIGFCIIVAIAFI